MVVSIVALKKAFVTFLDELTLAKSPNLSAKTPSNPWRISLKARSASVFGSLGNIFLRPEFKELTIALLVPKAAYFGLMRDRIIIGSVKAVIPTRGSVAIY